MDDAQENPTTQQADNGDAQGHHVDATAPGEQPSDGTPAQPYPYQSDTGQQPEHAPYAPYGQPNGYYEGQQPFIQGQPDMGQPYAPGQQFPPQGMYYPPAPNDQWNILCIIGFILSFPLPPVGMILSIIALVQINKSREKSKGMAIAGIVIGAVQTVFWGIVVALVAWGMVMFASHGMLRDDTSSSCVSGECSQQSSEVVPHTPSYLAQGYRYTARLTDI